MRGGGLQGSRRAEGGGAEEARRACRRADRQGELDEVNPELSCCAALSFYERVCLCGNTVLVWRHYACVATVSLCGDTMLVWQHCARVATLCLCGDTMLVWQHCVCVATLCLCGNTVSVWQHWACVETLCLCGNTGHVWKHCACAYCFLLCVTCPTHTGKGATMLAFGGNNLHRSDGEPSPLDPLRGPLSRPEPGPASFPGKQIPLSQQSQPPCVGSPCVGSPFVGSPCVGSPCVGSPCVGSPFVGSPCVGSPCVGSPGTLSSSSSRSARFIWPYVQPSPRSPTTTAAAPDSTPLSSTSRPAKSSSRPGATSRATGRRCSCMDRDHACEGWRGRFRTTRQIGSAVDPGQGLLNDALCNDCALAAEDMEVIVFRKSQCKASSDEKCDACVGRRDMKRDWQMLHLRGQCIFSTTHLRLPCATVHFGGKFV
eukprot:363789-Chlamydomonas_euryale.AAC.8